MWTWVLDRVLGFLLPRPGSETEARPLLKVRRASLASHADGVISAVVTRLVERPYSDVNQQQRPAWLLATYHLTVQNSGHAEYFRTYGVARAAETRTALVELGAEGPRAILSAAIGRHLSVPGETGFVDMEVRRPALAPAGFSDLDVSYRRLAAQVDQLVSGYIRGHIGAFVSMEA